MEQNYFMISDAAKKVSVETHVLRYWEEELELTIKRNELGHRYYTKEDIERFIRIKTLKEQGFQLKAIRLILVNGNLNRISEEGKILEANKEDKNKKDTNKKYEIKSNNQYLNNQGEKNEKNLRLQILLKQLISEAVRENNEEMCDDIKSSVLKELDYQFRIQEEREEEREKERMGRQEEHFRKVDELLRLRIAKKEKRKKHSFF